jgi:heme-degrading monooxygenase HmoA
VYVSVTRTKGSPDQPVEIATIAGEEMLPWLSEIDGFDGLLMVSNVEEGTTLVLSFWESAEVAERHRAARMEFRDRVTAAVDVEVEETAGYVLSYAHLGPRLVALQGTTDG